MDVNITLVSILVIVFLFIPGFFFKRFYYSGQFTKQFHAGTFAERFITSIIWGFGVQIIALIMTSKFTKLQYHDLRKPITDFFREIKEGNLPNCTAYAFYYSITYVIATILIASILGFIFHNIVRVLRIDILLPPLRFTNYWNYYFKGDIPAIRGNRKGKVLWTNLDVLVEDGAGKNKIYRGVLRHYTLSSDTGNLETIAINQVERWSNSMSTFVPVPGDSLIIPYATVVNLNLRYNIISRNWKDIYEAIYSIIILLILLSILFLMPYYYYNKIGLFKTILAVLIGLIDLLFLAILTVPRTSPRSTASRTGFIITCLILVTIFSLIEYFLLY